MDAEIIQTLLMKGFAEPTTWIRMALGRDDSGQVGRIQRGGIHDNRAHVPQLRAFSYQIGRPRVEERSGGRTRTWFRRCKPENVTALQSAVRTRDPCKSR